MCKLRRAPSSGGSLQASAGLSDAAISSRWHQAIGLDGPDFAVADAPVDGKAGIRRVRRRPVVPRKR